MLGRPLPFLACTPWLCEDTASPIAEFAPVKGMHFFVCSTLCESRLSSVLAGLGMESQGPEGKVFLFQA